MDAGKTITISREYGSGGRFIGKLLGEKLHIPVYDQFFIEELAKKCDYSPDFIRATEESCSSSFRINPLPGRNHHLWVSNTTNPPDKIFQAKGQIIFDLTGQGPCVIVGRCANTFLEGKVPLLRVFICADTPSKLKRIVQHYGIPAADSKKLLKQYSQGRKRYYEYYSDRKWGNPADFDLCLNTTNMTCEQAANLISDAYRHSENGKLN